MSPAESENSSPIGAGGLASVFVAMSEAEAEEIAARNFGMSGTARRLATEKDDTFRLTVPDGRRFILKVANPTEDPDEIDLQTRILRHIERRDPAIPVPRVVAGSGGAAIVSLTDRAGQKRLARLLTFLEGTVLDRTDASPAEREKIGEVLARLRLATATFSHPAEGRVLAWDVKHLPGLRPLLAHVGDPARRALLAAALDRFEALGPRIARLRTQVLHNDFNRSNLVVDHDRPEFVTGIIDFGDSVRTAVAIDVSTAVISQLPRDACRRRDDDLLAAGRDILRGYLRFADLLAEELALIPHLAMGRSVVRALLTPWRAGMFPENATYILRNTEPAWAQIEWFMARSPEEVSATLMAFADPVPRPERTDGR